MKANVMIVLFVCYLAFFAISWKAKKDSCLKFVDEFGNIALEPLKLILFHLTGLFFLGLMPFLFLKDMVLDVLDNATRIDAVNTMMYVGCSLMLLFIAFRQSKMLFEKSHETKVLKEVWNSKWVMVYVIVRLLFLAVYEFWFRGLLFFICVEAFGLMPAVSINVFLYVVLHVFSGKKEMLACLPFGLLACFFMLTFSSIWSVMLLHIGISFVYEYSFLRLFVSNYKTSMS